MSLITQPSTRADLKGRGAVAVCGAALYVVALIALLAVPSAILPTVALAQGGNQTVLYDDQIRAGFEDWSWAAVDVASTAQVAQGASSISVDYAGWDALYLGSSTPVSIPAFGQLTFKVHGGAGSAGPVNVAMLAPSGSVASEVTITTVTGQWQTYSIDLADFGSASQVGGFWWQDGTGTDRPPIWIDDIRLIEAAAPPATTGPSLVVETGNRSLVRTVTDPATGATRSHTVAFPHAISEGIYGQNFSTDSFREEVDVTVNRWGGNSTERYNHQIGTTNLGHDWYFTNSPDGIGEDDLFEADNQADGAATIMTVPMSGWVAKNREANCSYPVNDYFGPQHNVSPMDDTVVHWLDNNLVCGNGYRNGEFIGAVDPNLTSVAAGEAWATGLVNSLVAEHGTAAAGGVEMYALGNEPGLWHATHGDIRATPMGRDELVSTNISYATAIKNADPSADVIGPVLWSGYSYYATSEEVLNGQRPGDVPTFVPDYLAQMAEAERTAGRRLLDTLAVNFYDDRVYQGGTDQLRLQSTRSLWDPTYAPQDWWVIRDFTMGEGHAVIPRLNSAIDAEYPGTDLAITEYSFGGPDTLAGGLAQTDALGIFGREDLDIATLWEPYAEWTGLSEEEWADRPVMWAFRLFRSYDGNGSRFGDQALYATSTDEPTVSVYGARRTADGKLTVMIVNKATTDQVSSLRIDNVAGSAEIYRYSGSDLGAIQRVGDQTFAGSTSLTLPRLSATLLVIDPDDSAPPPPVGETARCAGQIVTVNMNNGELPTSADDVILGTAGDDLIAAGAGDDVVCGGAGNDRIWGQAGNDLIYGDDGADTIRGGADNDVVYGGAGNDDLSGSSGDDRVYGEGGADLAVRGGPGDDLVDGGPGNDLLVSGNGGSDEVRGGPGDDARLAGGPRPDVISGGDGNDDLRGAKGADVLDGGAGDDLLVGGPQPDSLDGGAGTDTCQGSTTGGGAPEADIATNCESVVTVP